MTVLDVHCTYYKLGNPALYTALIVTPAVYPHLNDFSLKKVDLLNLESQYQAKTFPWFSDVPDHNLRQIGMGVPEL